MVMYVILKLNTGPMTTAGLWARTQEGMLVMCQGKDSQRFKLLAGLCVCLDHFQQ